MLVDVASTQSPPSSVAQVYLRMRLRTGGLRAACFMRAGFLVVI